MQYSQSTGGFYDPAIHGINIPVDAVEITAEEHAALLDGQGAGQVIVPGPDGRPMLADPPAPTGAELAALLRAERNARIAASDWTQLPDAPLTSEAKAAWAAYRQQLRDITGQTGFPVDVVWPESPE